METDQKNSLARSRSFTITHPDGCSTCCLERGSKGVSSPDADLQRHELKAEAEAEWTLEEKIRPSGRALLPQGGRWMEVVDFHGGWKAIFEVGIGYG